MNNIIYDLGTLHGRTVCVVVEALEGAGTRADWIAQIADAVLSNLAAEIIAVEELTRRRLTSGDIVEWLTQAAERKEVGE